LVILVKEERDITLQEFTPQVETRKTCGTQGEVTGDNLSFRSGVRYAALTFRDPGQGETGRRSAKAKVHTRGRARGQSAAGKVGISEEMRAEVLRRVAYPPDQSEGESGVNVAHEAVELAIARCIPFLKEESKMLARADEIRTSIACTVQQLHDDSHRSNCKLVAARHG
jgi:hypothetical protein